MPFIRVTTPILTGRCSPCMFTYHHSVFEDTALISNKGAPGTTTSWNSSDVNSQVFSEVDSLDLRWTSGCSKILYGSISCNFMASFYIHAAKHMIKQKTSLLLWRGLLSLPSGKLRACTCKVIQLAAFTCFYQASRNHFVLNNFRWFVVLGPSDGANINYNYTNTDRTFSCSSPMSNKN